MLATPAVADAWRIWADPLQLAHSDTSALVVQRSSVSTDTCDYDAQGQVVPVTGLACRYDHLHRPAGRHRYLYQRDGELVIFDEPGAGVLTRVWMTTGNGHSHDFPSDVRMKVRLGGMPTPLVDLPVRAWFDRSHWPFLGALVGDRSSAAGAGYSYVPIRFRDGIRISLSGPEAALDAAPIWYHFNAHRLPRSALDGDGFAPDVDTFRVFAQTPPGQYPWPLPLDWQTVSVQVDAGNQTSVLSRSSADTLLALRIRPSLAGHLHTLVLRAWFDGELRIDQSLADLLGVQAGVAGDETVAVRTLLSGVDVDAATSYLFVPMPFHHTADIRLAQAADAGTTSVDVEYAFAGKAPPSAALRVRAVAHDQCVAGGRNDPDIAFMDLHGRGRWIGLTSWQHNLAPADPAFLEGDERVHVDGSPDPLWLGTGNEDFYNGGFYFHGPDGWGLPHALPFAGAPVHRFQSGAMTASRMYRWLLADAAGFQSRLRVNLERGAYGDLPMCSRGVALLYHEPARAQAPLADLDLDHPMSVALSDYQMPAQAVCGQQSGVFADHPPTAVAERVCAFTGGDSQFTMRVPAGSGQLWLRRRFDGSSGGQAATVYAGGEVVARFPYAVTADAWRWQEVTVPLDLEPAATDSTVTLRVVPDDPAKAFTDVAYTLLGNVVEPLFADGFESLP